MVGTATEATINLTHVGEMEIEMGITKAISGWLLLTHEGEMVMEEGMNNLLERLTVECDDAPPSPSDSEQQHIVGGAAPNWHCIIDTSM